MPQKTALYVCLPALGLFQVLGAANPLAQLDPADEFEIQWEIPPIAKIKRHEGGSKVTVTFLSGEVRDVGEVLTGAAQVNVGTPENPIVCVAKIEVFILHFPGPGLFQAGLKVSNKASDRNVFGTQAVMIIRPLPSYTLLLLCRIYPS